MLLSFLGNGRLGHSHSPLEKIKRKKEKKLIDYRSEVIHQGEIRITIIRTQQKKYHTRTVCVWKRKKGNVLRGLRESDCDWRDLEETFSSLENKKGVHPNVDWPLFTSKYLPVGLIHSEFFFYLNTWFMSCESSVRDWLNGSLPNF